MLMVRPEVPQTTGHSRGTQAMPSLCPQSDISGLETGVVEQPQP